VSSYCPERVAQMNANKNPNAMNKLAAISKYIALMISYYVITGQNWHKTKPQKRSYTYALNCYLSIKKLTKVMFVLD